MLAGQIGFGRNLCRLGQKMRLQCNTCRNKELSHCGPVRRLLARFLLINYAKEHYQKLP
jgi:hypothetical protein